MDIGANDNNSVHIDEYWSESVMAPKVKAKKQS